MRLGRFCSKRCRQTAWRLRRRRETEGLSSGPKLVAYGDPPYPGLAHIYRDHPDYRGEVDHRELVASLVDGYDAWALSTSQAALGDVLELCPREHRGIPRRVAAWGKPNGVSRATFGPHNVWEPVIYYSARLLRPGVRDFLVAKPARGGGSDLIGRKPIAFCAWLFDLLGLLPGDELVDIFPGSGIVSRAWAELSRNAGADTSPRDPGDASRRTWATHASLLERGDTSPAAAVDASPLHGERRAR